jgi:hypothetical protein
MRAFARRTQIRPHGHFRDYALASGFAEFDAHQVRERQRVTVERVDIGHGVGSLAVPTHCAR